MEHGQRLQAAQYRLAQHYLEKLRTAQRTYQQGNENATYALAIFDREREQVKQWQAWAVAHAGQDERVTAFCNDYAGASPDIFKLRLLPQEYLCWLEAALEAARRLGDQRAEAVHLLGLCAMSELINEHSRIIDYAQQALSIARQIDDRPLVAQSLNLCANAIRRQGNLEEAQAYYEQSLILYRAIGDHRGMAEILNDLGVLAIHRRNNAAAQDYMDQSLALCREVGDQQGLATCLSNLGFLAIRLGNYTAASGYLEQSLAVFQTIEYKKGISMALTNLATVASYQGKYSLAQNYLEQGLVAIRAAGVREREPACLFELGKVTMAQGDLLSARDYFQQCLAFRGYIDANAFLPISLSNLAITYLLLHQEDLANTVLREGLEVVSSLPVVPSQLKVLVAAARVWVLKGKPVQAATWLGLVANHPHPAVKMTDIQRDVQAARAECAAALSPEQFAAAWEEGKTLSIDTVIAEILNDLS